MRSDLFLRGGEMTRPLTEEDIRKVCGGAFFERGRRYQRDGKVLKLEWDEEAESIVGQVSGSYRSRYRQDIDLFLDEQSLRFDGDCSCPVGENCKHIAAVLLQWIEDSDRRLPPAPSKPAAFDDLSLWQSNVLSLASREGRAAEAKAGGQSLLYRLRTQPYRDNTRVFLGAVKSRLLKKGGWGKSSSFSLNQLTGYFYPPSWADPLDIEIAELAARTSASSLTPVIAGDLGTLLLRRLLKSGRCFFESEGNPPLSEGPARRANFEWLDGEEGSRSLRIDLEGVGGEWIPVPTDPPWYIDTEGNRCGPIAQPLSSGLFHALCHLPPVEEERLGDFSLFLSAQLPPDSLPLPAELDLERWDGPPTPVLVLLGQIGPGGRTSHVARLLFAYGPCRLPPAFDSGENQELHRHGEEDWMIRRDPETEREMRLRLESFGLAPAQTAGLGEFGQADMVFAAERLSESALLWQEFLRQLPDLESQGWTIERQESFSLTFERAESIEAVVDESDGGWFDIGLDIEYRGERLPLLPLLIDWLEHGDPSRPILFTRGDGAWLEIPQTVLTPILGTLLELYQGPQLNEAGQLRLSRPQAPWLGALEEEMGDALKWRGGKQLRRLSEKLRHFEGIEQAAPPASLQAELRPYQEQGLSWLQFLRSYSFGGILADDMGLGKTLQTLAHLMVEKEEGRLDRPALVVVPTSVLGNWKKEAARFTPDLKVLLLHGPKRAAHFGELENYDLVVTSYALLVRDVVVLKTISFHSLILDEAQAIKNGKAKAAQAACAIGAQNRLCLTGTPLENHLGELWSLFNFLMPGFLGTERSFNSLFRHPIEKRGDTDRREELVRRIAPFILRRDKKQVATELPPKTEMVRTVELDGPQRRLYESIRVAMAARIGDLLQRKGVSRSHIEMLDALLKLRQVCCDPRLVKLQSARKVSHSAKLKVLTSMLEELLEEGRKVLLFSQFTSMLTLIEEELKKMGVKYAKLTGQTRKREEAIARFQEGEVPLFLVSLKAGGVGLNLTAADTVIHYDPWWNPAVENQATDRAYRIGQDKPVFVYKLVTEDTVEEKILQLQQRKQALADDIYQKPKKGEEGLSALSSEDILDLFR